MVSRSGQRNGNISLIHAQPSLTWLCRSSDALLEKFDVQEQCYACGW